MRRNDLAAQVARHRLHARLNGAIAHLPEQPATPTYLVDLDAFDANAADLVRRAAGKPIRVASKSLRVPALIERALRTDGFAGVLAYSLREAIWLAEEGISDDIVMGYPSVDLHALGTLTSSEQALRAVTVTIDDVRHLDLLDGARAEGASGDVRVALDVDAGLRVGPARLGPRRSPLDDVGDVVDLAEEVVRRDGFRLVGVLTSEGRVAGVPDEVPRHRVRSAAVRRIKQASVSSLADRRAEIASALHEAVGELEFCNAGGTGSLETSAADPAVTELSAGSGLVVSGLFDHYRSFDPLPAAYFGLRVSRRPSPSIATVAGGGLIASGPTGSDRAPVPWAPPGLHLTSTEGAGEVQTPLTGPGASALLVGELVWFRHAKAGEVAEHTHVAHLMSGSEIVDTVPTYRGAGQTW